MVLLSQVGELQVIALEVCRVGWFTPAVFECLLDLLGGERQSTVFPPHSFEVRNTTSEQGSAGTLQQAEEYSYVAKTFAP